MKIFKYTTIALVLILGVTQCKMPDNINPKAPTEVPVSTLFTNAEVALFIQVDECNVNINTTKLISQYYQETTYFDESRYLFQDRQIPDGYVTEFYRDALMDFQRAKEILSENDGGDAEGRDKKVAVIDILMAYGFLTCLDGFGNLPYSEALQMGEDPLPAYDDAHSVYQSEIDNLISALDVLKGNGNVWGVADVMYGGDEELWKKFGASFLLRCGMRLADVDAEYSKKAVNAAVAAGVFTSQDEAGFMHWNGIVPYVNSIYDAFVVDGRKDFLPTNTIIDIMDNSEKANVKLGVVDPRIDDYFTKVDTAGNGNAEDMIYIGAIAGFDGAQTYQLFSHFQDFWFEPTFPAMIIDYVEVEFLLAEAAQRGGYNVAGTAKEHYDKAVTASIVYWGNTEEDAATYLAAPAVAYNAAEWKNSIGTQKWIALFNRGIEAWAEWRRLDHPKFNVPPGMVYGDIPLRMPYPYNEVLQNQANYEAASAAIGGDYTYTPLFWDVIKSPYAN